MARVYKAAYVTLHVRKTNRAALALYRDTLSFGVHEIEKAYCKHPFQHSISAIPRALLFRQLPCTRAGGGVLNAQLFGAHCARGHDHDHAYGWG